jgi:hypothetical protein
MIPTRNLAHIASAIALLSLFAAGASQATSITVEIGSDQGCVGECLNTDWSLTISDENVVDPNPDNYNLHVTMTATFGSFLADQDGIIDPTHITAVEFGIPGQALDANLTSSPGTSIWSNDIGPLNGKGCGGGNGNFTCSEGSEVIALNDSMSWEWDILVGDVNDVLEFELLEDFHIGAKVERELITALSSTPNGNGPTKEKDTGWLLSVSPTSPVPEPSAALLYFVGVLMAHRRLGRPRH